MSTTRWRDADGKTARSSVEIPDGWGGCGEFEADLWAVVRDGELFTSSEAISPVAIFDADGDGRFEMVAVAAGSNLVTDLALLRETDGGYEWLAHATRSFHGCPC